MQKQHIEAFLEPLLERHRSEIVVVAPCGSKTDICGKNWCHCLWSPMLDIIIIIIERRDIGVILSNDCKDTLQTQNSNKVTKKYQSFINFGLLNYQ